jgi:putative heme-binding domain-containing protein
LPAPEGIAIATTMLAADREADQQDKHIPLLLWWALEAHCSEQASQIVARFQDDPALWESSLVRNVILSRLMHRLAAIEGPASEQLTVALLEAAPDRASRRALMTGFEEALARGSVSLTEGMAAVINRYRAEMPQTDLKLRLRQRDPQAIQEALQAIDDRSVPLHDRLELIALLSELQIDGAASRLQQRVTQDDSVAIQRAALNALARFSDPAIGRTLAAAYHRSMDAQTDLRPITIRILASRPAWAGQLIEEIDALRLPAEKVSGDVLLQMRSHDDPQLTAAIDRIWGKVQATPAAIEGQIADLKHLLKKGLGDRVAGQKLFQEHCGKCHKLFGEGGQVGPDLTGYERTNLDFLTLAVLHPSAAIREEFTNYRVLTTSGQVLSGLLENQTAEFVTLRTVENQAIRVPRDEIEDLQASATSLMPAELLQPLSDQQIRDLFAYLMGRTR